MPKQTKQETIERLQALTAIQGTLLSRVSQFAKLGYQYEGDRDLYQALGYKIILDETDYYAQYTRQDMAKAIINKPVNATWRGGVKLLESADDKETQLEKDWSELYDSLHLHSVFARLDKLVGLNQYGILLLGMDDVSTPEVFRQELHPGKRKLLYVKPLGQPSAQISEWETDTKNPRYGFPSIYNVTIASMDGDFVQEIQVHHSRIIHVAGEDLLENELYGSPRLEVVFNRLKDLEKLTGGSAEMFWRGARPGYQGDANPDYQVTGDTLPDLQDQLDEYENNLRRVLVTQGVNLKPLATQVSDPSAHVDIQIQMIAAVTGIPKRILVGSERGELASSQDQGSWFDFVQSRREEYAEPGIVRPFVDRLIEIGIIAKPVESYSVEWSSLFEQSEADEATVGKTRAETLKSYSSAPTNQDIIPPDSFLRIMMKLSDEDIELIKEEQDAMVKQEEKDMAEAEKAGVVPPVTPNVKQSIPTETPKEKESEIVTQGGPGSGNFGHTGRPGKKGGSGSGGGAKVATAAPAKSTTTAAPKSKILAKGLSGSKWVGSLTDGDIKAINRWTGDTGYKQIRTAQKKGKIDGSTKAFEDALNKDGSYDGTVYRGLSRLNAKQAKSLLNAKEIKFDAHSSASKHSRIAEQFASANASNTHNVIFEIKAKTGVDIGHSKLTKYPKEAEVVLKRGTKYKVGKTTSTKIDGLSGSYYRHRITLVEQ